MNLTIYTYHPSVFSLAAKGLRGSLSVIFLMFFLPVFSQNMPPARSLKFIRLGEAQGLIHPKVTAIFQDSFGFVWIGTQGGLQRYDGYEFTTFEHQPGDPASLPGNYIAYHAFHEDKNRDLWIATYFQGLVKFDRRTEKFRSWQGHKENPAWLNYSVINAICGDGKDGLWIGPRAPGLVHFQPDSTFKVFDAEKICSKGIVSLLRAKNGTLWIGTFDGVTTLDAQGNFRCFRPHPEQRDSLSDIFVPHIFEDKKGRIWVATRNGLNLAMPDGSFQRFFPESHPDVPKGAGFNYILRVFEDSDGDFWLGTNAGLLRFDPIDNSYQVIPHRPTDPSSIGKGAVHGIVEDRQGNLWFATDEGISILNKKTALLNCDEWSGALKLLPSVIASEGVKDLAQTGDRFWFSTQTGLFTFKKGETVRQFLPGAFTRLLVDREGRLLAGTVQPHWFIIDPKALKVLEKKGKERRSPRSHRLPYGLNQSALAQDRHGTIWMGVFACLNRCDFQTGQCRQFFNEPSRTDCLRNSTINDLLLDSKGNLWIATNGGVSFLSAAELSKPIEDTLLHFVNSFHDPHAPHSLSSDLVLTLFEDSRGQIWAGTEAGLNLRFPDGRWQRFLKKDGLPSNKITGIIEDTPPRGGAGGVGNLWLSTANNGLSKFDGKRFFNLTEKDGLTTRRFYSGACLRTSEGKLVFAGYNGVNCFDPTTIDFQHDSLPLHFTDFKLYGKSAGIGADGSPLKLPAYLTEEVSLPFGQKSFSVKFSALNFANPEKQLYRYKLEGFDEAWYELEPGKREVTFTRLFPRKYLLRVQSTADGDWSLASEATLSVRILKPWWMQWWALGLYALALFSAFYAFYKFRVRRKLAAAETRRLRELDEVKTRLYTNITHEFRTPLTIILGETEQVKMEIEKLPFTLNFPISNFPISKLATIRRNGQHLLNLVNQMLDMAKLEGGSLKLNIAQGDVILFLKYLLESFHSLTAAKKITLRFSSSTNTFTMDYDAERLRQIVSNLLSNAIKFTPSGGEVRLDADVQNLRDAGHLKLSVSDTGTGIPPEQLPRIFDRFYQVDDSATRHAEGTGIGLTLTKELVKLLGGTIEVQSEMGKGTTFMVSLPVGATFAVALPPAFQDFKMLPVGAPLAVALPAVVALPTGQPHGASLLLIEDNEDVLNYVSSILKKDYHIETAPNGKAGLEKAFALLPDLILSDVMMPEMDGYEVCQTLKNDLRTSHIPIVLLTAKADFDSRMVGLEGGAEAYLAKPFEEQELLLVLRKLLENRELLQQHFTSGEFIAGGERPLKNLSAKRSGAPPTNSYDEQFLQEVLRMVEVHLDDPDLSAERLAHLLLISYNGLFKKIKTLTGMGVTEYVRHIRLHRAAGMLQEPTSLSVSQISIEVGFNNLNFFSREFRKCFGHSPTEHRSRVEA